MHDINFKNQCNSYTKRHFQRFPCGNIISKCKIIMYCKGKRSKKQSQLFFRINSSLAPLFMPMLR